MSLIDKPTTRRPRLIVVNRYFYPDLSATSQMLFDLARRLSARGIEVHVICANQLYEDPAAVLPVRDQVEGIEIHRLATTRFGRGQLLGRAIDYASFYVLAMFKLLTLAPRTRDVLVAKTDPPLISVIVAAIARMHHARAINWLQDLFPEVAAQLELPLPAPLDRALRRLRDASLRSAKTNVVLGERMRDYLIGRGIAAAQITIIENWADGEAIRPMPVVQSRLRAELGLGEHFVVEYSGNLGRAHEYETILEAAKRLAIEKGIVFLMIGGGAKMAPMKAAVAALGLANIRFLPYQPREALADSLAAADLHLACLLPSLEGLIVPSKFYGILAAGRPSVFIGDRKGELARVVESSDCGRVVETGDDKALADIILELRAKPELAGGMGKRARQLFDERYTAEHAAARWMEMLKSLGFV